jgi:hypothetical protein
VSGHDEHAAERIAAYLDAREPYELGNIIATTAVHPGSLGAALRAVDLREVLRQLEEARQRNRKLALAEVDATELRQRSRTSNDLARQLADRTDELATLQQQFDDFRDVCSGHSADRAVEQIRLEDAEAALVRYGGEMARLCEAAKAFQAERDEARQLSRVFIGYTGGPCARWLFARQGLDDAIPPWLAATEPPQPPAAGSTRNDDGAEGDGT